MAQTLPQELVDLILCEFKTDIRSERRFIAQCGLICRAWLPSSRYRLFADFELTDRNVKALLRIVETSPFPIPTFIRSLAVSSCQEEDGLLEKPFRKLGPLPQVTTLRVTMDHDVLALNVALLAQRFANLPHLVLHTCKLPISAVFDAVSRFPALKNIGLHWVGFDRDAPPPLRGSRFPSECNTLSLNLMTSDISAFFKAVLSLDTIPVFTSLSVYGADPKEGTSLGDYLRHMGDRLHHFCFERSDSVFDDACTGALSFSTGLRRLDLVVKHAMDVPGIVLRVLIKLHSIHLTAVNVTDTYGNPNVGRVIDERWQAADKELAHARFANLRAFTFEVSPEGRADVSQVPLISMPLAQARGILRISLL
ncbi:hypothetical protein B0H15DRAFT_36203 [Mycena belliarum]|uniref:Uncharacterized protein n=1 Tax=Mycena belliarum TaxID=1033014 RepID=A0AAD6UCK6_9AGAR|nr:hypothetical protein B0H15DRAFT_36203 [Mycena belliae]